MKIKLYHDAFLQFGGAERIPLVWASEFQQKVNCFAVEPELFSNNLVLIEPFFRKLRKHRTLVMIYPLAPIIYRIFSKKKNRFSEISLVSSSGLAHLFAINSKFSVLYLNTPTRWIWKKSDFEKNISFVLKAACGIFRPTYRYVDRKNVRKFDLVICNSVNIQQQIKNFYQIDSVVVYPPITKNSEIAKAIENTKLPSDFFLIVARNRGYKFNDHLVQLSKLVNTQIVLCGKGTEKISGPNLIGLGFVSEANLNWLYQNAKCLIGLSEEDFGLTPVEAALFGCPTIAFRQGGYIETVMDGINGSLIAKNRVEEMAKVLNSIDQINFDSDRIIESASRYSQEKHISQIKQLIELKYSWPI